MTRLRFLTAGESHGPALVGILDGMPAGVRLLAEHLARDLQRRKLGYGRGGRMKIEPEVPRILATAARVFPVRGLSASVLKPTSKMLSGEPAARKKFSH